MGSSTENSAVRLAQPPRHVTRPGRFQGSAAAVAAGFATLGFGSDTGGSIRQPAALCGVVGVKPTYGVVSRMGLVAFASSLDQIGPFATTVADAALALEVIGGHDPATRRRSRAPRPSCAPCSTTASRVCVGRITDLLPAPTGRRRAGRCRLRRPQRRRGEDRRRRSAGVHLRADGLLPRRPVGGVEQPGPLRRRALRPAVPAADTNTMYMATRAAGLRRRGSGGSCSAPTPSRRATTTPTTARR